MIMNQYKLKEWIVALSKALRECYPELNDDLPIGCINKKRALFIL